LGRALRSAPIIYNKVKRMKQLILSIVFLALPFVANAQQQVKYGYFSYKEAFTSMPDYAVAKRNMDALKAKYDAEMKRVEDEFNNKYEEFLDGQKDFAPSILRKRQAELQELMEKNLAFKEESKRLLKQAEDDAYAPLKKKLSDVIRGIGDARGYAFILNTDNEAVPYVSSVMGEDITALIKDSLR
jgi:outer membrane protein